MSGEFQSFNANDAALTICGIPMENLSEAGYSFEYVNNFETGRMGINKNGIKTKSTSRPMRFTINLMPGSPEKTAALALLNTDQFAGESFHQQIGATEAVYMYMPVFESIGSRTRAVPNADNVTDDVLTVMFMDSKEA